MRTGELAQDPSGSPVSTAAAGGDQVKRDLLSALAGNQASRERAVGESTRRVVMASLGVMREQAAGRKRSRSLVLASFLLVVLALGPFVWRVSDDLIGGEHFSDIATQTSLWVCVLCPVLLAAALVAGWARTRP